MANGGTPTPTPVMYEIKIEIKGSGTVSGGGSYEPGATVTLRAEPAADYVFDCWKDSLNNIVAYSADYTFVVGNSNATYKAIFKRADTPTPTPTNTPTPTPTNTPTPTPTPVPVDPDPQDPDEIIIG